MLILSLIFGFHCALFAQISEWKLKEPIASNIDGALFDRYSGNYLFFSRAIFVDYNPNETQYKTRALHTLPNWPFGGKSIDAAVNWDENIALLFQGDRYFELDLSSRAIVGMGEWPFPEHWHGKIDAAVAWTSDLIMFLKGGEYLIYNTGSGESEAPARITDWEGWPAAWTDGVNAVMNPGDGFIYFFRNSEFLIYNQQQQSFVGGPRDIKTGGAPMAVAKGGGSSPGLQVRPNVMAGGNSFSQTTTYRPQQLSSVGTWCLVGIPPAATDQQAATIESGHTPFGGAKGSQFEDRLMAGTRVAEIRVYGSWIISGIQTVLETPDGQKIQQPVLGKATGAPTVFAVDPDECITGITGAAFGPSGDYVYSLQIQTTKRISPLFGGKGSAKGRDAFNQQVPPGAAFAGFWGRAGNYMHAIGLKFTAINDGTYSSVQEQRDAGQNLMASNAAGNGPGNSNNTAKEEYFDDFEDYAKDIDYNYGSYNIRPLPAGQWLGGGFLLFNVDPLNYNNSSMQRGTIFEIMYENNFIGNKGEYFQPYGTKFNPIGSGSEDSGENFVRNFSEFQSAFTIGGGVSVGVPQILDVSVKNTYSEMNSTKFGSTFIYVYREIFRRLYSVNMELTWRNGKTGRKERQRLNFGFRDAVGQLPTLSGRMPDIDKSTLTKGQPLPGILERVRSQYESFIGRYGSHFSSGVTWGGKYISWYKLNREEFEQSNMAKNTFEASVSGTIKKVSAGADFQYSWQQSAKQGSVNQSKTAKIFVSGGNGATDYETWTNEVAMAPQAVKLEFTPVSELFNAMFFPNDPDIDQKREIMEIIVHQYYLDHYNAPLPDGDFYGQVPVKAPAGPTESSWYVYVKTGSQSGTFGEETAGTDAIVKIKIKDVNGREVGWKELDTSKHDDFEAKSEKVYSIGKHVLEYPLTFWLKVEGNGSSGPGWYPARVGIGTSESNARSKSSSINAWVEADETSKSYKIN